MEEESRKESYASSSGVVSGLPKCSYAPPMFRCPKVNLGCWNGTYVEKCEKKKGIRIRRHL